jgi:uncharacterized protein
MTEHIIVSLAAIAVAALTLFSGFGLGTLLLPVMALFFSVEIAVAATAIVHLVNNIFKGFLVGRHAKIRVLLRFAIPAVIAAFPGALLLTTLAGRPEWFEWTARGRSFSVEPVNFIIAILMVIFALIEIIPQFEKINISTKWLPLGGILSGFFGGISGHQGALRSAFLSKAGLTRDEFIGTSVMSAIMVDIARLAVYGVTFYAAKTDLFAEEKTAGILITATLAAFLGSFIGARLVKKITMRQIQIIIGVMLLLLAVALGSGVIG